MAYFYSLNAILLVPKPHTFVGKTAYFLKHGWFTENFVRVVIFHYYLIKVTCTNCTYCTQMTIIT